MTALTIVVTDGADTAPGVRLEQLGTVGAWLLSIPAVTEWREEWEGTPFRNYFVARDGEEIPERWPDGTYPTLTVPVSDAVLQRYEDQRGED